MAKSLNWKYSAKKECENKNLYTMTSDEKDELCKIIFSRLSEIKIDSEKAHKVLSIIRGE